METEDCAAERVGDGPTGREDEWNVRSANGVGGFGADGENRGGRFERNRSDGDAFEGSRSRLASRIGAAVRDDDKTEIGRRRVREYAE